MEAELKRRRDHRSRPGTPASPAGIIAGLWDRARQGTYFECLGISPEAGTSEVRDAWMNLAQVISNLKIEVSGSPELLEMLLRVERVAADGFEVLSDPDLRLVYSRALDGHGSGNWQRG